jgi:phosphoglycolate phosphatase-like HAD superfamily hydrolase
MRLVLLDIDGTLLDCGRQTRPFFGDALRQVFGVAGDVDNYDFAGRTDPGIAIGVLTAAGVPRDEVIAGLPRLREVYLARLAADLDPAGMCLLPGVRPLLERLSTRDDVLLGLLTGNWEPGARTKLSRLGLDGFFRFGAYGGDGIEREELPPVALERAERLSGRRFAPHEALIVGDSRFDVACARAHGIPSLAVATGHTPAEALREAGADWVVPDLIAAGRVLDLFAV